MRPLAPADLYHACSIEALDFTTTSDLEPQGETLGQERAMEAIHFGVGMRHEGYNLFVMGSTGLGRHTMVRRAIETEAVSSLAPDDWCYIADFERPHVPRALRLPAGTARRLRRDMEQLVDDLLNAIPAAFHSAEYQGRARAIREEMAQRESEVLEGLAAEAQAKGVTLMRNPNGYSLAPEVDGEVLTPESFQNLPEERREELAAALEEIKEALHGTIARVPEWQRELRGRMKALDHEVTGLTVAQFIEELRGRYHDLPPVLGYLDRVQADIVENVALFRSAEGEGSEGAQAHPATADAPQFNRYRINVLVDNADTSGAPVVFEDSPTYQNLIGRVEHLARMGTLMTDFTLIKPGALHRANGGFLVLDVEKVLTSPFAWVGLKRALLAREVRIESLERQLSLVSTISLEPEPVPIDLKVVLIGGRELYYLLKEYDPEFNLLFKVTVDLAEELPRTPENELSYARLIAGLQRHEGLRDLTREGVARLIEHAARETWEAERLTLHLGNLGDRLREADYWAGRRGAPRIEARDVQAAIDAQTRRSDQIRQQLHDHILRGTIKIDTDGIQLAQINGLSVLQLGDVAFGMPTRISATARLGSGELVDIQRETEQGGPIHSKGVLILSSYLAERYAKHQPLSVSASLVFEQTYSAVEGDSASVAELCALLSAMGDIPLRQDLAITGSINQHGEVQAIGGVCQKIEGFFDLCEARGLTGQQGCIIPLANVKDLMLKEPVVRAAREGRFAVWAVRHVEEAMELLTGLPAGRHDADGVFTEGTINGRIQTRLAEWIGLKQFYSGQIQADLVEEEREVGPTQHAVGGHRRAGREHGRGW